MYFTPVMSRGVEISLQPSATSYLLMFRSISYFLNSCFDNYSFNFIPVISTTSVFNHNASNIWTSMHKSMLRSYLVMQLYIALFDTEVFYFKYAYLIACLLGNLYKITSYHVLLHPLHHPTLSDMFCRLALSMLCIVLNIIL